LLKFEGIRHIHQPVYNRLFSRSLACSTPTSTMSTPEMDGSHVLMLFMSGNYLAGMTILIVPFLTWALKALQHAMARGRHGATIRTFTANFKYCDGIFDCADYPETTRAINAKMISEIARLSAMGDTRAMKQFRLVDLSYEENSSVKIPDALRRNDRSSRLQVAPGVFARSTLSEDRPGTLGVKVVVQELCLEVDSACGDPYRLCDDFVDLAEDDMRRADEDELGRKSMVFRMSRGCSTTS